MSLKRYKTSSVTKVVRAPGPWSKGGAVAVQVANLKYACPVLPVSHKHTLPLAKTCLGQIETSPSQNFLNWP